MFKYILPLLALSFLPPFDIHAQQPSGHNIPSVLEDWKSWSLWGHQTQLDSPATYDGSGKLLPLWPSKVEVNASQTGCEFQQTVRAFTPCWVNLPGDAKYWPQDVKVGGQPIAILPHNAKPSIWLEPGEHTVTGRIIWNQLPQKLPLPPETGLVRLTVNAQLVDSPLWDNDGHIWLNKSEAPQENAGEDSISTNLFGMFEDGIPLKFRLRLELIVSGKVREEVMGSLIPEGWSVSAITSTLPVALEKNGTLLLQVRPGKWEVDIDLFHIHPAKEINFPSKGASQYASMLLGFRGKPEFRTIELGNVAPIDVSLTTFPANWRGVPVFQWSLDQPLVISEKMRGTDEKSIASVNLSREWWLDVHGNGWTSLDNMTARALREWRLDVDPGFDLGSVRIDGTGQLVTKDPKSGKVGIELREQNMQLQATGRISRDSKYPATGWLTEVDQLDFSLNLPPGWRLFSLFGSDWVRGDWLTSWSLMDIFIVLLVVIAAFRIWGAGIGMLLALTIILTFKEPGAPQYLWIALLLPLAVDKFSRPEASFRRPLLIWKWATVTIFVWACLPFVWSQIQQSIYPQLEQPAIYGTSQTNVLLQQSSLIPQSPEQRSRSSMPMFSEKASDSIGLVGGMPTASLYEAGSNESDSVAIGKAPYASFMSASPAKKNLSYDAKSRIQTGPGIPSWQWRRVSFGWNGPVSRSESFSPILIPPYLSRLLTIAGILGLFYSLFLLLGGNSTFCRLTKPSVLGSIVVFISLLAPTAAHAQYPDRQLIEELRQRLVEETPPADQSADILQASANLQNGRIVVEAEVHTSKFTALPLPGQLPAWSPVRVTIDGAEATLLRHNGYLWTVLSPGIHQLRLEGLIPPTEWEWAFQLKPRRVSVRADDWIVTGLSPDGIPDQQIIFSPKQKDISQSSTYDRQDFPSPIQVIRNLEIGLDWQIRTTVRRLASPERALTARIPLLQGERLLSSNLTVQNNRVEIRLPSGEEEISWQSELPFTGELKLTTKPTDEWVEQWNLTASPVWNVQHSGLAPVYQTGAESRTSLSPTWNPWPGESVNLIFTRPEAIQGATVTVHSASHHVVLGKRQATSNLTLKLNSSLGGDFNIKLPTEGEVTSLTLNQKEIPARMEKGDLVVPINVGEQVIQVQWRADSELKTRSSVPQVALPVEASNVEISIKVPDNRWIWWVSQSEMSPAVKFWIILAFGLVFALLLSRLPYSPLSATGWVLLALGLTQGSPVGALIVVAWLFLLKWRQSADAQTLSARDYNIAQVGLVIFTFLSIVILFSVVASGLLGRPDMFIEGNNSSRSELNWYFARTPSELPTPWIVSGSIWWYRLAMLGWALWLALSLLSWLGAGWKTFWSGGLFKRSSRKQDATGKHLSSESVNAQETPPPLSNEK
jgi:hypothetical protein